MAASRDNDWRNSDQLVDEIHRLVEAGSTGTLFVRTADDHLGCVVFANGEIVSVMFRGVRGVQGLEYVRAFDQSTFHFDENALLWEDPGDLPDTREILRKLGDSAADDPGALDAFDDPGALDADPGAFEPADVTKPPDSTRLGDTGPIDTTHIDELERDRSGGRRPIDRRPDSPRTSSRPGTPGERSVRKPPIDRGARPIAPGPPGDTGSRTEWSTLNDWSPQGDSNALSNPNPHQERRPQPSRQRPIALSATELKRTVIQTAMSIMGPLGRMICEEEFARAGILGGLDDLEQLLRRVANEIDDDVEARDFCETVLAKAIPREGSTSAPRAGVTEGSREYNKLREVIESEAVEFLGPLAELLCDEFFSKYSAGNRVVDIGQVINSLVDEIGDLQRADEFRERIAKRLG